MHSILLDHLTMNITQDQYMYENRGKTFDPNLSSAANYSPPPSVATTSNPHQSTVATHFHTISHNEINAQHVNNVVTSHSEYSNVTYSNVIFLPAVTNSIAEQVVDTIELVKNESETTLNETVDSQHNTYKYIVSSDPPLINTFIRTSEIDNAAHQTTGGGVVEQSSNQMIATVSGITENGLLLNDGNQLNVYSAENGQLHSHLVSVPTVHDPSTIQMHSSYMTEKNAESEIIMQAPNGQLYRHVHNIYVNHTNELVPAIIQSSNLGYVDYGPNNEYQHQTNRHNLPTSNLNYELNTNYTNDSNVSVLGDKVVGHDPEIHPYIENEQNMLVHSERNSKNVYQKHDIPTTTKDQQRMLMESTMSPLRKCSFG